jgi:hypothetical protein
VVLSSKADSSVGPRTSVFRTVSLTRFSGQRPVLEVNIRIKFQKQKVLAGSSDLQIFYPTVMAGGDPSRKRALSPSGKAPKPPGKAFKKTSAPVAFGSGAACTRQASTAVVSVVRTARVPVGLAGLGRLGAASATPRGAAGYPGCCASVWGSLTRQSWAPPSGGAGWLWTRTGAAVDDHSELDTWRCTGGGREEGRYRRAHEPQVERP